MNFLSTTFIFGLLPIILIFAFFLKGQRTGIKRVLIAFANVIFYLWAGVIPFLITLSVCIIVWLFIKIYEKSKSHAVLNAGIIFLVVYLTAFKVLPVVGKAGSFNINLPGMLGLSFYTFMGISLLADIKRGSMTPSFTETFEYLLFFPTVTSGPIIRYSNFKEGLEADFKRENFEEGVRLFIVGLAKKILVADKLSLLADFYFDGVAAGNSFSTPGLWIGSIAYSLQLYFDFSGYSQMASGIARVLGIKMPPNFDFPYISSTIREFWKRWHISLSTWFKDYVYIPLGGSRKGVAGTIRNLAVVWLLTGLWHGIDLTFVIWGIGYLVLLLIEKFLPPVQRLLKNKIFGHIYTLFFVNLLWVFFRSDNVYTSLNFIKGMFGITHAGKLLEVKAVGYIPLLVLGIVFSIPYEKLLVKLKDKKWFSAVENILLAVLFILSLCAVLNSVYTPYIYGKF